tara:strand:- start:728 stop:1225 length:498 start_codon:yes stop_codon:yes gene_type:complete
MSDDIVENLKEPSQWLRIAYMIALAVALYVASVVLTLLTIAQAVFSLLTGKDNLNLRALGKDLGTYVHQILEFLTYNSELKPFPFSPYPGAEEVSIVEPAPAPTPAPEKSVEPNKAAPKKAAPKKAAPKKEEAKKPASKATATRKTAAKKAAKSSVRDDDSKPEV